MSEGCHRRGRCPLTIVPKTTNSHAVAARYRAGVWCGVVSPTGTYLYVKVITNDLCLSLLIVTIDLCHLSIQMTVPLGCQTIPFGLYIYAISTSTRETFGCLICS